MPLVFDSFPSFGKAFFFRLAVEAEYELTGNTYSRSELDAAHKDAMFPFKLTPPVVLLERPYSGHDSDIETARNGGFADDTPTGAEVEERIATLAATFGGRFAGT